MTRNASSNVIRNVNTPRVCVRAKVDTGIASLRPTSTSPSPSYVIPRSWVRDDLYVDDVKAKVEDIWNS